MAAAAARQSVEGGLPLFPRCFVDPWSSFAAMEPTVRLNVTLDAEHAAKLERLARRTHTQEGTLAGRASSRARSRAPTSRSGRLVTIQDGRSARAPGGSR